MADENTGTEIWEAAGEVRELANDIIAQHHPHLADANFVFLMRSPTAKSKDKLTLGTAKKASPEQKALYTGEVDFIMTLAGAEWKDMTNRQRRALLDHELCHCVGDSETGWAMRGHDVEEFAEIIERHGLWHGDLEKVGEKVRQLNFNDVLGASDGGVESVTFSSAGKSVTLTGADMRSAGKKAKLSVVG
jgi:hypothetical protein